MPTSKQYVQYGCGLSAPDGWINFDVSPTLRIGKIPILGQLVKSQLNAQFPSSVRYGDITKGLPGIAPNSCDGLYCSHVLEHLSLQDFRIALQQSYEILKPGGLFRIVVPDLESMAHNYQYRLSQQDPEGSIKFMQHTILGVEQRPKGLKAVAEAIFGNAKHLWMWDQYSLMQELINTGFTQVRRCYYHDSEDEMFELVEAEDRFKGALAVEASKS